MVDPLLSITFDDITTEKTDGFVGDLTLTCALFDGLEVLDRVFSSAESILLLLYELGIYFKICVCDDDVASNGKCKKVISCIVLFHSVIAAQYYSMK